MELHCEMYGPTLRHHPLLVHLDPWIVFRAVSLENKMGDRQDFGFEHPK